jgi:T4-like virus tail tube protein gp19
LVKSEVSGLTIEIQSRQYRDGASPEYSVKKMSGMPKYGNIILKRGIITTDNNRRLQETAVFKQDLDVEAFP